MPDGSVFKGLKKAGPLPLLRARRRDGWLVSDYRVRELFDAADVMSEGAWREGSTGARHYFGTTSIFLSLEGLAEASAPKQQPALGVLLRADPHVRLRALRIACREARVRARDDLCSIRAELSFALEPRRICIHVELEARAHELPMATREAAR